MDYSKVTIYIHLRNLVALLHVFNSDFLPHLDKLLFPEGLGKNIGKLIVGVHVLNLNYLVLNALPDVVKPSVYVLAPLVMYRVLA
jgi:hypothetical protein